MVGVVEMVKEGTLTKEGRVDRKEAPIVASTVEPLCFRASKRQTEGSSVSWREVTRLCVPTWLYLYMWSGHECS